MGAVSVALFGACYTAGTARAWASAGLGRGVSMGEAAWFAAGFASLAAASIPGLQRLTEASFAAHMLQHQILLLVAPALLSLANVPVAFAWLWPLAWRRAISGTWRVALAHPAAACLAHALALWVWHAPLFFDTAVAVPAVHSAQHASFMLTGIWFWTSLRHGALGRAGFGAAVLYVFATALQSGALGALLVVSPRLWYASSETMSGLDWTALEDQQVAGLLMWIPASAVFTLAGLGLLGGWIRESGRRARSLERG